MPSFDITSETDMVALKNAIDVAAKTIINRYDFKGTSAKVEFPALEKKEPESSKRLEQGDIQKISGNKVKQVLTIKDGIDKELAKKIITIIKDSKLKVQSAIQGDEVRITGKDRDILQSVIALMRKSVSDFPLQYQNFRD